MSQLTNPFRPNDDLNNICSKVVVLLLFIHCTLLLALLLGVNVIFCFVLEHVMFFLVLLSFSGEERGGCFTCIVF